MASVLDELVLLVGLDPSKFEEGRRALESEIARVRTTVQSFGEGVEHTGKSITDVFGLAKTGITGLLAAFVGGEAAAFIDRVATMDAHTMQLAHSIGTSTRELSLWQNMVRAVGGDAGSANAVFAGLNDAFMNIRMGNQMPSGPFATLMTRAGIDFRTASPGSALASIMGFLQGQPEQNQRFFLQNVPGMNESMMFLLMEIMRHPDKMRNLREELEKIGLASEKSGQAALELAERTGELRTAWEALARVLFPMLTSLANQVTGLLQKFTNPDSAKKELFGDPKDGPVSAIGNYFWDYFTGKIPASGVPLNASEKQHASFIMGAAASLGMDPNFAVTVAEREGLFAFRKSASGQSFVPGEQSFGDFQLNMGPKGLGTLFQKQTGLDPRDPKNWMAADRFALEWAKKHGWSDFHGSRGLKPPNINVGSITVNSSKADPAAVADQIPEAMRRYSTLAGINTGLV